MGFEEARRANSEGFLENLTRQSAERLFQVERTAWAKRGGVTQQGVCRVAKSVVTCRIMWESLNGREIDDSCIETTFLFGAWYAWVVISGLILVIICFWNFSLFTCVCIVNSKATPFHSLKFVGWGPGRVAQLLRIYSWYTKVAGLIPSKDTCRNRSMNA